MSVFNKNVEIGTCLIGMWFHYYVTISNIAYIVWMDFNNALKRISLNINIYFSVLYHLALFSKLNAIWNSINTFYATKMVEITR